ncbi:hypothetical protein [Mycoplasma sp. E35C]|uniref:hypothetical protein n=1 Tax=Mycoplasma sp. E35C TaxID=2801918 RepID=UPI001CA395C5|nr:hypothetical protein [Mycoplasma sp. E35C]QZX49492.1 hypothetical protein JJE79_01970 [Mycoplasma sp. E35C]
MKLFKRKGFQFLLIYISLVLISSLSIYLVWKDKNIDYENEIFWFLPLTTTFVILFLGILFIFLSKKDNDFNKLKTFKISNKLAIFSFLEILQILLGFSILVFLVMLLWGGMSYTNTASGGSRLVPLVVGCHKNFDFEDSMLELIKNRQWMHQLNWHFFRSTGLMGWISWNIIWLIVLSYLYVLKLKLSVFDRKHGLILLPFSSLSVIRNNHRKEKTLNSLTFIPFN